MECLRVGPYNDKTTLNCKNVIICLDVTVCLFGTIVTQTIHKKTNNVTAVGEEKTIFLASENR